MSYANLSPARQAGGGVGAGRRGRGRDFFYHLMYVQ